MSRALVQREIGQIPISIATSLAIEGFYGTHPDNPVNKKSLKDFSSIWINIRTLIRNIDGAIQKDERDTPKDSSYYDCLLSEIHIILNDLRAKVADGVEIVFYAMSYQSFTSFWPNAIFQDKSTEIQLRYAKIENNVLTLFDADVKKHRHEDIDARFFDTHISSVGKDAIVLTHFPVDLMLTVACSFDALLESHTGKIKLPAEWNTKLKDGKKHPRIPFDRCMIQIFGDSSGMIKMQSLPVRKKILEIAEKHTWNAMTKKDRICLCVNLAKEPVLMDLVNRLY